MPVQIDMEMSESCEVCPASRWAGAYCREDSTFCPLLTEHHEKDGKRNPNCPLIKTEDSTWHIVADGDLPEEVNKTYQCTVLDKFREEIVLAEVLYGTFVGFFCDTYIYGVLAWRELPEPWEGAKK